MATSSEAASSYSSSEAIAAAATDTPAYSAAEAQLGRGGKTEGLEEMQRHGHGKGRSGGRIAAGMALVVAILRETGSSLCKPRKGGSAKRASRTKAGARARSKARARAKASTVTVCLKDSWFSQTHFYNRLRAYHLFCCNCFLVLLVLRNGRRSCVSFTEFSCFFPGSAMQTKDVPAWMLLRVSFIDGAAVLAVELHAQVVLQPLNLGLGCRS